MRRFPVHSGALLALLSCAAVTATAQAAPRTAGQTAAPRLAIVSGVVHDSLGGLPLAGALVQLAGADSDSRFGRTVVADGFGRFRIDSVPDGRYLLGFHHPMLDSIGVEAPARSVTVSQQRPVVADLAIPSAARLRIAVCGAPPPADVAGSGAVIGVVRDAARKEPVAGARVTGEWMEFTIRAGGIDRRMPRVVAKSAENGWFVICNVPTAGTMFVSASHGADTTDLIEVAAPTAGLLRRDLYLGAARVVASRDSVTRGDSVVAIERTRRLGDGRLSGRVLTAIGRQPLAGAQVRVAGGPQTTTNARGDWMLADVPAGTRTLDVRAVGYYPVRQTVDVITNAPAIDVSLSTLKSVLDTVRVTASRVADRHNSGFAERRRSGTGRYLSPEDIARRGAIFMSDLFRAMVGVRIGTPGELDPTAFSSPDATAGLESSEQYLLLRGMTGDLCVASVYLDGMYLPALTVRDLDNYVRPEGIAGIEVYSDATVPAAYQRALSGCGVIIIWTK